jgi:hypothetical protein
MRRPDWVPGPAWRRLDAALRGQPAHACDALGDLSAVAVGLDVSARERLLARFCALAEAGVPLPAAFIVSVSDLFSPGAA